MVKMALAKARRNPLYEGIADDCYGIAFFGNLASIDRHLLLLY